ncbi:MAG: hypothetical protein HZA93_14990 [Verrucomicrobia bacterium]|nr:hypothetical protein [Verrucomicrobiota bacterium]
MIYLWAGRPGAGKSYNACREMVAELVTTKRIVVTNLTELDLGRLQEMLDRDFPALGVDVTKRVRVIQKDASRHFYRFRGPVDLEVLDPQLTAKTAAPGARDKALEVYFGAEAARAGVGVTYFIDEAHRHFPATEWAELGPVLMFYFTQHRHLDDNVYLLSQAPEQIASPLRRLVQECRLYTNRYRQSFLYWKKPGGFEWHAYYSCADMMATRGEFDKGVVRLEPEKFGRLYSTRGALGNDRLAPEQAKPTKKLPFWTLPAAVVAAVALFGVLAWQSPKVIEAAGKSAFGALGSGVKAAAKEGASVVTAVAGRREVATDRPMPAAVAGSGEKVFVQSVVRGGARYRVELTDGTVMTDATGGVVAFGPGVVALADGRILAMRRIAPSVAVRPVVPVPEMSGETASPARAGNVAALPEKTEIATAETTGNAEGFRPVKRAEPISGETVRKPRVGVPGPVTRPPGTSGRGVHGQVKR